MNKYITKYELKSKRSKQINKYVSGKTESWISIYLNYHNDFKY